MHHPSAGTIRRAFLDTVMAVRPLVAAPEVAARWQESSALREFTVGGLTGHLVRAVVVAATYLDDPEPDVPPISAAAYYANLTPDLMSALNTGVRERGESAGRLGPHQLLAEFDEAATHLQGQLSRAPSSRLLTVARGEVMELDEYLKTRIVELVVHADDLAVSVALVTPPLPPDAVEITIETMLDISRYRHGDLALLRALSRRERDLVDALRVF